MVKLSISLAAQVPTTLPAELYTILNDVYIQLNSLVKQLNRTQGIVQSPNGHYWALQVSNSGAISATDLGTTLPA